MPWPCFLFFLNSPMYLAFCAANTNTPRPWMSLSLNDLVIQSRDQRQHHVSVSVDINRIVVMIVLNRAFGGREAGSGFTVRMCRPPEPQGISATVSPLRRPHETPLTVDDNFCPS
jgi:hypothetical protein